MMRELVRVQHPVKPQLDILNEQGKNPETINCEDEPAF